MSFNHIGLISLILFLTFVFVLATRENRYFSSRKLNLLRALFPSWKFFEEFAHAPILYYRVGSDGGDLGEWEPCLTKQSRSWGALFLNPRGNYLLACHDLVDHFLSEAEEFNGRSVAEFSSTVSYRLVARLARERALSRTGADRFQFKVTRADEEVLSLIHEAASS